MATSIEKVSGIGPATATLLADHGINSAEDLAAKRVGDLATIKGFNSIRAGQVIEAAKQLTIAAIDNSAQPATPDQKNKEKKDKKKKQEKDKKKKSAPGKKSNVAKDKKKSAPKKGKDKKKSAGSKKKSSKKK